MLSIAIAREQPLFYEGDGAYGYGLWPSPVISVATLIHDAAGLLRIPAAVNLYATPLIFREDSFDAVTRVRRGRLYRNPGTQPQRWHVQQHPAFAEEVGVSRDHQGWLLKDLHGFVPETSLGQTRPSLQRPLLAIGILNAFTLWRVVDVEHTVNGEDFLTLRARNSFGVLPELIEDAIPADSRVKAVQAIEKVAEAAYRAGPESVVDRVRDAAQWCIGAYLASANRDEIIRHEDLGQLTKLIPVDRVVLKAVAQALARLHSRAKPNEQARYDSRPLVEGDAEFALVGLATVLRELGWAR
jgi:hypothetical protein